MKKEYISPAVGIIKLEQTGMLCISGEIGGEAIEPAYGPEMVIDDEVPLVIE